MNTYEKVLITGASSGMGRAVALRWSERGATARRPQNLEALTALGEQRITPVAMAVAKIQAIDEVCGGLELVALAQLAEPKNRAQA